MLNARLEWVLMHARSKKRQEGEFWKNSSSNAFFKKKKRSLNAKFGKTWGFQAGFLKKEGTEGSFAKNRLKKSNI